jgi:predicted dehydrogenase
MRGLKVGVIGLGFMGHRFSAITRELPTAKLVAVADIREEVGRKVADDNGAEYISDGLELIHHPDIEAVVICTPEDAHVDFCLEAIRLGKAILVEKPISHTVESARQITRAARQKGVTLMVGHTLRFNPAWAQAKERILVGEIGEVKTIRTKRVGPISNNKGWLEGRVSVPLFYGVHDFDIQRWFAASEPVSVYAQANYGILSQFGYDVEDILWAIVRFQNGVLGVAELGWHYPDTFGGDIGPLVEVTGTKGCLTIHQSPDLIVVTDTGATPADTRYAPLVYGLTKGAWQVQLDHFVHCVLNGEQPRMTGEDATEALRLSLAAGQSAREGQLIDVQVF